MIPPYTGHRRPQRPTRRALVDKAAAAAPPPHDFAIAAYSLDIDMNVQMILRNLACFNGKEMFIIGSRRWFKGATNGLEKYIPITYFNYPDAFMHHMRKHGYSTVAVELADRSVAIQDVVYPPRPCFIFGNETYGVTGEIVHAADQVVQIPMNGLHPCLNVAVTSGIVIYDYLSKTQ